VRNRVGNCGRHANGRRTRFERPQSPRWPGRPAESCTIDPGHDDDGFGNAAQAVQPARIASVGATLAALHAGTKAAASATISRVSVTAISDRIPRSHIEQQAGEQPAQTECSTDARGKSNQHGEERLAQHERHCITPAGAQRHAHANLVSGSVVSEPVEGVPLEQS